MGSVKCYEIVGSPYVQLLWKALALLVQQQLREREESCKTVHRLGKPDHIMLESQNFVQGLQEMVQSANLLVLFLSIATVFNSALWTPN